MNTIFINSGNTHIKHIPNTHTHSKPHILLLNLNDKIYLGRVEKSVVLSNLSIYYTWENIKSSYRNNKFKISTPTWNDKFELPDRSNSVSDT